MYHERQSSHSTRRGREPRGLLFEETPEVFVRRSDLLPQINRHLDSFFKLTGRNEREIDLMRGVVNGYMATRHDRGKEITSEAVSVARTLAQIYFQEEVGDDVLVITEFCMDRRVRKGLVLGFPARFGRAFRSPGANPADFSRAGFGDQLVLNPDSNYASDLERASHAYRYILGIEDSHYGCAARGDFETNKFGIAPADGGVVADRLYKRKMVEAIGSYAKVYGKEVNFIFIQTSFDPHTGFLDYFEEENPETILLSTKNLAYGPLEEVFKNFKFNIDWLNNYGQSASRFWRNIMQIRGEALPTVKEILKNKYPGLEEKDPRKFGMMARIALLSAYSGWLNNLGGNYPHDYHNEDLVVASAGGEFGPYPDFEAFEIAINSPEIREDVLYAARLVRRFREQGNAYGEITDPVPFIIQARVSSSRRPDYQQLIDLSGKIATDIPNRTWMKWDFERLMSYVGNISDAEGTDASINFGRAFANLVRQTALIYDTSHPFANYVYEGHIVPVPLFVDDNGSPLAVLPLVPK